MENFPVFKLTEKNLAFPIKPHLYLLKHNSQILSNFIQGLQITTKEHSHHGSDTAMDSEQQAIWASRP